jgi:hypothetical protein
MVENLIIILNKKDEYVWTRDNIINQLMIGLFNSKYNPSQETLQRFYL